MINETRLTDLIERAKKILADLLEFQRQLRNQQDAARRNFSSTF